jgi:hypothetical protein
LNVLLTHGSQQDFLLRVLDFFHFPLASPQLKNASLLEQTQACARSLLSATLSTRMNSGVVKFDSYQRIKSIRLAM